MAAGGLFLEDDDVNRNEILTAALANSTLDDLASADLGRAHANAAALEAVMAPDPVPDPTPIDPLVSEVRAHLERELAGTDFAADFTARIAAEVEARGEGEGAARAGYIYQPLIAALLRSGEPELKKQGLTLAVELAEALPTDGGAGSYTWWLQSLVAVAQAGYDTDALEIGIPFVERVGRDQGGPGTPLEKGQRYFRTHAARTGTWLDRNFMLWLLDRWGCPLVPGAGDLLPEFLAGEHGGLLPERAGAFFLAPFTSDKADGHLAPYMDTGHMRHLLACLVELGDAELLDRAAMQLGYVVWNGVEDFDPDTWPPTFLNAPGFHNYWSGLVPAYDPLDIAYRTNEERGTSFLWDEAPKGHPQRWETGMPRQNDGYNGTVFDVTPLLARHHRMARKALLAFWHCAATVPAPQQYSPATARSYGNPFLRVTFLANLLAGLR